MKLLVAKLGSNAIPRRPRSPEASTINDTNGVDSKTPFLITRSSPVCWQTNNLPSGANSIAVALNNPAVICVSVKPEGRVAALALKQAAEMQRQTTEEMMKRCET